MAIKGKKKSQSRGSQGQRRPAAAPRPTYTARRHTPWYKTNEGRLIGGILIAVVVGVTIWLVSDAQKDASDRSRRRDELEAYSTSVRTLAQTLSPVADEMVAVLPDADVDALGKDAKKWTTDLAAAQTQSASLVAPDGAEVANSLFTQSLASFASAAQAFEAATGAPKKAYNDLLAQATEERDQAAALFALGIDALDEELLEVDGELTGIVAPGSAPASVPLPEGTPGASQEIVIPPDPQGGGGKGGKKGGGGGAGGGDKGDGN